MTINVTAERYGREWSSPNDWIQPQANSEDSFGGQAESVPSLHKIISLNCNDVLGFQQAWPLNRTTHKISIIWKTDFVVSHQHQPSLHRKRREPDPNDWRQEEWAEHILQLQLTFNSIHLSESSQDYHRTIGQRARINFQKISCFSLNSTITTHVETRASVHCNSKISNNTQVYSP